MHSSDNKCLKLDPSAWWSTQCCRTGSTSCRCSGSTSANAVFPVASASSCCAQTPYSHDDSSTASWDWLQTAQYHGQAGHSNPPFYSNSHRLYGWSPARWCSLSLAAPCPTLPFIWAESGRTRPYSSIEAASSIEIDRMICLLFNYSFLNYNILMTKSAKLTKFWST